MLATVIALATTPVDYRALGTEPFWALTIGARTMQLEEPGQAPRSFPTPPVRTSLNGRSYVSAAVKVDVTRTPCSDGMSDRRYPDTVTVTIGRRTLRGCGGLVLPMPTP